MQRHLTDVPWSISSFQLVLLPLEKYLNLFITLRHSSLSAELWPSLVIFSTILVLAPASALTFPNQDAHPRSHGRAACTSCRRQCPPARHPCHTPRESRCVPRTPPPPTSAAVSRARRMPRRRGHHKFRSADQRHDEQRSSDVKQ